MNKHYFQTLVYLLLVIVIGACSAGGGETGTGQAPDNNVSVGVITAFGSVYVNDVKYATSSNTTYSVDGDTAALESQLAVGMLVTISGNIDADGVNGSASSIVFENNVEGLVTDTVASSGALKVLGQTVIDDNNTVFHSNVTSITDLSQVEIGHIVEVSGFSNGDGNIYATRIELKKLAFSEGDEIEIKGKVSNLTDSTFQIGEMTVNYASATLEDFDTNIANGDFVSVESHTALQGDIFVASEVEFKEESDGLIEGQENQEIEFEGIVSQLMLEAGTFDLNSQPIIINDVTEFEKGERSDLADGIKIRVDGYYDGTGNVIAEEIKFREQSVNYFEGTIETIDYDQKSFVLNGVTIFVNNSTRLKDDSESDDQTYNEQYFKFADLVPGNFVEVSAFEESGNYIATKLVREDEEPSSKGEDEGGETPEDEPVGSDRELRGIVSQIDLETNKIIVSQIEIDISFLGQEDLEGLVIDAIVEVHGKQNENGWFATEIEIEMEN